MKKRFTALCALAIALLLTVPAAAQEGIDTSGTTSLSEVLNDIDFDSDNSIQLMFAKLQLAQAQLCKDSANSCMQQIQELQEEQTLTADTLEKMRRLQAEGATEMPEDMLSFMRDRDLAYCEPKDFDCWAYNIESLTVYQDSLTAQTQSLMVNLQAAPSTAPLIHWPLSPRPEAAVCSPPTAGQPQLTGSTRWWPSPR